MKPASTASVYSDLASAIAVGEGQTVSKPLFQDDSIKIVLFGFAEGQELSEHTATVPAILHFTSGKAAVTLGSETIEAGPGTLVHMPAHLRHSIVAQTETRMLLFLLKKNPA